VRDSLGGTRQEPDDLKTISAKVELGSNPRRERQR
jgi:hypothetical protein